ncbi:aromatic ring-hydroxylating oxygenase subunit alpha [Rhodalgimonas zhirmunskyi]|uniref:Aromatic ring-hydroxylating dioxygenase subunit alpha n=1 Tax=Rhodalgimonas zhirmunskyi TaxID=2964767 RepID=A0AAJ1X5U6_9RHOB|nr:aromatic ring-hydroxylating dioxygenase subunit alpha [Rhodoalgimonas zhirmunskyi]MDQ2095603.1 aromatic ring-hydroxylating dioxygenase subunit alpha [Rhodoalgimonas zhirmunskyi]
MTTDLSAVLRPIARAGGLPNAHYIDPAQHEEERQALLLDQWAGLAVAAQVPEPGDALPIDFLGAPLLLLRDRAGKVRVFHNVCRHRGMILVSEPRRIEGAIRCPYHSWCYSTEGKLVATPHVGGPGMNRHDDMPRSELGLVEVPSAIWRDVVFVNVNANAAPFEEVHADLLARWAEFDSPHHHGGADSRFSLTVKGNWKLAVENYCESYHLPWVHPGLNSYSRLEDHYNIEAPGLYSGQGTLVYRQIRSEDGTVFPDFPSLSDKWDEGAEYVTVYPNVLLGAQRDHAFAIILAPQGQEETREDIHLYYASPETDDALRARNTAQWREVFEEDVFVVEGMQKGRHTPGFDGGRFSPAMDGPTHCFHDWVARTLTAKRQRLAAE